MIAITRQDNGVRIDCSDVDLCALIATSIDQAGQPADHRGIFGRLVDSYRQFIGQDKKYDRARRTWAEADLARSETKPINQAPIYSASAEDGHVGQASVPASHCERSVAIQEPSCARAQNDWDAKHRDELEQLAADYPVVIGQGDNMRGHTPSVRRPSAKPLKPLTQEQIEYIADRGHTLADVMMMREAKASASLAAYENQSNNYRPLIDEMIGGSANDAINELAPTGVLA